MPLAFAAVCELLEECYRLCVSGRSLRNTVESWFAHHRSRVDAHDTDIVALLSTLLPEKRPDRVYFIQAGSLEKIIGRSLALGASRIGELTRYRQIGSNIDLAGCVEGILQSTASTSFLELTVSSAHVSQPSQLTPSHRVTMEEVDALLNRLAAKVRFSSPALRATWDPLNHRERNDLQNVYRRLSATEAKWLTRMVLKDFAPLNLDENMIYRLVDPCLPTVLKVHQDFACATHLLQSIRTSLLPNSTAGDSKKRQLLSKLKPQLGVKVARQYWLQARSIKHCLSQGSGRMSIEDKIDGEYCQIHVDLTKGPACVQIFSKSGKDSTEDRAGLHSYGSHPCIEFN
jgi:DNA ligase-4